MRLLLLCLVFFSVLAPDSRANLAGVPLPPGDQCRAAIIAAERGHAIPPRLLAAIGRVESGRRDPGTGAWGPWPWTINAEGTGSFFDTKAQAIAAVQALRARGVRSIDVGCMQVNLMHHPDAFASLDQAFEPAVNADYAARFLSDLHAQTGDWMTAAAHYHSANPAEGTPYAAKVAAAWPEEQRLAGATPIAPAVGAAPLATAMPPPPAAVRLLPPGAAASGHGLAYYWSTPVRPVRTVARISALAALR